MSNVIRGTLKDAVDELIELAGTVARTADANAAEGVPHAKDVATKIREAIPQLSEAREPASKVERFFNTQRARLNRG